MTLRLTELYSSIQGEGPNMGVVTSFVRFGGCNMRCPGWPCDTQHAIQPSMWRHDPVKEAQEIMRDLKQMPGKNVCITGGEPTMQDPSALQQLANSLILQGYTIDVFTNGSLHEFPGWMMHPRVSIMLDWKLRGSGEAQRGLPVRLQNVQLLRPKDGMKFVICDEQDFEQAAALTRELRCEASLWAGVAWGRYPEAKLARQIIARDLPWRMNIQVHKFIWPEAERGI